MPSAVEGVVHPRLPDAGELEHVEVVLAHGVTEPEGGGRLLAHQFLVKPVVADFLVRGPGGHHHGLAVLRARGHEIDQGTRGRHAVRRFQAEAVLRRVARANPFLELAGAALPYLDRLGAEHVERRADRVKAVDVVGAGFRVEELLHVVVVLEHVFPARELRRARRDTVRHVGGLVAVHHVHRAHVVRERVGEAVIHVAGAAVVYHDGAGRHVRRADDASIRGNAFRQLYGHHLPAFLQVVIP